MSTPTAEELVKEARLHSGSRHPSVLYLAQRLATALAENATLRARIEAAEQREAWWRELRGLEQEYGDGDWPDDAALRCYHLEVSLGIDDLRGEEGA